MFEVIETLLIQLVGIIPYLVPFILVMNLASNLLWGDK